MKKYYLFIILIFILFPKFSIYRNAYQDSLWTYDNFTKSKETNDIILKTDDKLNDIKKWNRIRFGFPTSSITIDYQSENGIIQSRIEPNFFIINLLLAIFIIMIIWFLKFIIQNLKRKNYR